MSDGDFCTIGEAARRAGVSVRTIRYYEEISLIPSPQRTGSNRRLYSDSQVKHIQELVRLKNLGFRLADLRKAYEICENKDLPLAERYRMKIRMLEGRRAWLRKGIKELEASLSQAEEGMRILAERIEEAERVEPARTDRGLHLGPAPQDRRA